MKKSVLFDSKSEKILILFDKSTEKIFIVLLVISCNNMHVGVTTFRKHKNWSLLTLDSTYYFDNNSLKTSVLVYMNSLKYIEKSCKNSLKMSVLINMNSEKVSMLY